MTSLSITCKCGERFDVDERYIGQVISCWKCKRQIRPRARVRTPSQYVPVAPRRAATWAERWRGVSVRSARALRNAWPFSQPWIDRRPVIFFLALASWLSLVAVASVAVLLPTLGDRWVPATVLLYAGRWIWLVPPLGLALLATVTWRALLIPNLLAVAIAIGPVMGWRSGWQSWLPAPPGEPLRVVSLNAGGGSVVASDLTTLLDEWRPDIVAFQECGPTLQGVLRTLPRWYSHNANPLCLLSKYPIAASETMDRTDLERVRGADGTGAGGAGFVARYLIETPAGPLGFTNLHLETARKGLESVADGNPDLTRLQDNMDIRALEAQRARAFAEGAMQPMIIAGDFNAPPESRNMRDSFGDLTNAFSRVGSGFGTTRHNGWIRLRIDHVLHSTGLRAVRARIGRDVGSDHRPMIVDFRILERVTDE